jgi:serine/threonine protein kinase/formylglycine-generating enzyme required for sulfatase activity
MLMAEPRRPGGANRQGSSERRVDAACDAFEAAWKAGQKPLIEDYLARQDEADQPILLGELIGLELELRRGGGEQPAAEEYHGRFPDHAGLVRAALGEAEPGPGGDWNGRGLAAARNVLLGLLALQDNFINRDELLAAFTVWVANKSRPLSRILFDQGVLDSGRLMLLEALVVEHLKIHGDNPETSLSVLSSVSGAVVALRSIADPDVETSLHSITAALEGNNHETRTDPPPTFGSGIRYRKVRPHAKGGLGEVFVAFDAELNREVALKEIQTRYADDPQSRARFLLEAEVTGRLEHPGIVPVYSLGRRADGQPYYAMRFIEGRSLREAIHAFHGSDGPRSPDERARAFRELLGRLVAVCQAVAFANARGVLHRDLKPANVMLGEYGETLVVDWGLAKVLRDAASAEGPPSSLPGTGAGSKAPIVPVAAGGLTPTVGPAGTPAYMSPEQVRGGPLGPATDIYGLGAMLYELLVGRPPVSGRTPEQTLEAVLRGAIVPPREVRPSVHRALEAVCLKALAREPSARYPTARALAEDIERWLADLPVSAWREPWSIRARRWAARHRTAIVSASVASLVAGLAMAATLASWQTRGVVLAAQLESADIQNVRAILDQLEGYHWAADPRLAAGFRNPSQDDSVKLRDALGLLNGDGSKAEYLIARLLRADPRELVVIREVLLGTGHRLALEERLWGLLGAPAADTPARRFRAACGLAHSADDPRWGELADEVVARLLDEHARNPVGVLDWTAALVPLMPRLVPALNRVYGREDASSTQKALVARLLKDHARQPDDVVSALVSASREDFEVFLEALPDSSAEGLARLRSLAGPDPGDGPPSAVLDEAAARRQARAVMALARLGDANALWTRLRQGRDPTRRSFLIDLIAPYGGDAHAMVKRLDQEPDPSVRRAILLALGQFTQDQLPVAERRSLAELLTFSYRIDPDPGVHSAIDWLLREWKLDAGLRTVDAQRTGKPAEGRRWFLDPIGQTYAVIPKPGIFLMGSPNVEPGRENDEVQHPRWINRSFAIATKEVTYGNFMRFRNEKRELLSATFGATDQLRRYSPDDQCPMVATDWYTAIMFCRWLSEQEHVKDDQMCYPSLEEIKKAADAEPKNMPRLPKDLLSRTGYRLPTEAEWEYACRAGTTTERYYGRGLTLLPRYAWYVLNSGDQSHPVGFKKPNDLGLFDALGNIKEWCQYPYRNYWDDASPVLLDEEVTRLDDKPWTEDYPVRGGSFKDSPEITRASQRHTYSFTEQAILMGIRPARTVVDPVSRAHIPSSR